MESGELRCPCKLPWKKKKSKNVKIPVDHLGLVLIKKCVSRWCRELETTGSTYVIPLPDVELKPALSGLSLSGRPRTFACISRKTKWGGSTVKKQFHNDKISNVKIRLFLRLLFAARSTPRAITRVLAQQTNKASECSLEEEKLNPTGPSAIKAELYKLLVHADY